MPDVGELGVDEALTLMEQAVLALLDELQDGG